MLKIIELFVFVQGEFAVRFIVKVTLPAKISAGLGVYTGCRIEALLNVPEPDVVQLIDAANWAVELLNV